MKLKVFQIISLVVLSVWGVFALTGCISDSNLDTPSCNSESGVFMKIDLDLPSTGSGIAESRGDSQAMFLNGIGYDNWIDDEYRIYFFDEQNKFIGRFIPNQYTEAYSYGEAPKTLLNYRNFKIVAFANIVKTMYGKNFLNSESEFELIPGVTTLEELCNAEFTKFYWEQNGRREIIGWNIQSFIPVFGVEEYSDVTFTLPHTELPKPVTMLRALARLHVILEVECTNPHPNYPDTKLWYGAPVEYANPQLDFKQIDFLPYNSVGYMAPSNVSSSEEYKSGYFGTPHLAGANNTNDRGGVFPFQCNLVESWIEGSKRYIHYLTYVPEYNNEIAGGLEEYAHLRFQFNDNLLNGNNEYYNVYFTKDCTENIAPENRLNIVRSNVYRINISVSGGFVKAKLHVDNWKGYDNNFNVGDGQTLAPVAPWSNQINNDFVY